MAYFAYNRNTRQLVALTEYFLVCEIGRGQICLCIAGMYKPLEVKPPTDEAFVSNFILFTLRLLIIM